MADKINPSMVDALREALAKIKPEHQIPMNNYVGKSLVEDIKTQIRSREINHSVVDKMGAVDRHLQDALLYGQAAARVHRVEKTLADFQDHELVMEMIRRGYAAMKLPKDGGPPEVLR